MTYNYSSFAQIAGLPIQKNLNPGVNDIFATMLKNRQEEQALEHGKYQNEYLKHKAAKAPELIQSQIDKNKQASLYQALVAQLLGPEKASEAALRGAQQKYYEAQANGEIGKGGSKSNPYYGLPQLGKLAVQQQEIDSGYLPGSNGSVSLSPEDQELYSRQNRLQMQKLGSDAKTRERALFASNIEKTFASANPSDLARYSGPSGRTKLLKDQSLDLAGQAPEEYMKYKEALTAAQFEAKEIRQFLGDSITPSINEQLKVLTNPTGIATSPEAAKRQIAKAREIIRKQLKTYQSAIAGPEPYQAGKNNYSGATTNEYGQPIKTYTSEDGQTFTGTVSEARGRGIIE